MKTTRKLFQAILLMIVTGIFIMLSANDGFAQRELNHFSNWETQGNWFQKKDNIIALDPGPEDEGWQRFDHYLWSKRKYGDFVLKLEFKIPKDGNSGVFIRVGNKDDAVETGMEVQILDTYGKEDVGPHDCGGIIGTVGPDKNMAKPFGEWNKLRITARGSQIKVRLNSERVVNVNVDTTSRSDRPALGYIGFQDEGRHVWYRNISIKELNDQAE